MVQLVRLTANDQEELLDFLNDAYDSTQRRDTFDRILPAMWRKTDEAMGKHLAVRDGGKIVAAIGIYPLTVHVGDKTFTAATTGNVGVKPEYRGKGLMKLLMDGTNEEVHRLDLDAARLGGRRQRYGRHGYEHVGTEYCCRFDAHNMRDAGRSQNCSFRVLDPADSGTLALFHRFQEARPMWVERSDDIFYDTLRAWTAVPYAAYDAAGNVIGGLTFDEDNRTVFDTFAPDEDTALTILTSFVFTRDTAITVCLAPWEKKLLAFFGRQSEKVSAAYPTMMRILNWEHVADAFMTLCPEKPAEEFRLGIEGYGTISLGPDGARRTEKTPELTLNRLDAAAFLFGWQGPELITPLPAGKKALLRSFLPIPLFWGEQDRV